MHHAKCLSLLVLLPLVACASSPGTGGASLSPEVVALAKTAMPGGEFVLEVADDGSVLGAEASIPLSAVPAVCRDSAQRLAPAGRPVAAVKEFVGGRTLYEVQMDVGGLIHEILLDPEGNLVGREDMLAPGDYPASIVSAAQAVVPGTLVSVERITGPESRLSTDFHVKIRSPEGEVLKVCVSADGKTGRILRKLDAEIQVER